MLGNMVKAMKDEPDDPLTTLIEEYLKKRKMPKYRHLLLSEITLNLQERSRPPGRLSPSSICGCERQAAFRFLGAPIDRGHNATQELIFADGHWRHHKWETFFKEMERILGRKRFRLVGIELDCAIPGLFVGGSLDAEVEIKVNGKWVRYIIDIKGANDYAYKATYNNRAPNPTYVKQLRSYMKARGCKRGILLFESKDKNTFFCFTYEFTNKSWGEIRLWCERVVKKLDEHKLPDKHEDCQNGKFLYGVCDYKPLCFGKRTDRQIAHEVYVDFPGVKAQWKRNQGAT